MREELVNLKTDQVQIEDKSNFNRNIKYESISNLNNKKKKDGEGENRLSRACKKYQKV